MMVGYEMNFYEKKFNEYSNKLSNYLYRCLKETIGEKISGFAIEENLLNAWSYYFVTIADEKPKEGDQLMLALINHFGKLMNDTEHVKFNENKKEGKYMLDISFTRIWFGTSLNLMLFKKYGKDDFEQAFRYIHKELLDKESKIKTLMLT